MDKQTPDFWAIEDRHLLERGPKNTGRAASAGSQAGHPVGTGQYGRHHASPAGGLRHPRFQKRQSGESAGRFGLPRE